MSWNSKLSEEYFKEEASLLTQVSSGKKIACAYKRGETFELSGDEEIHLSTTESLVIGELLEDEKVILTILGSPGSTTDWEYKIYVAQVKIKPGQEILVEWLD